MIRPAIAVAAALGLAGCSLLRLPPRSPAPLPDEGSWAELRNAATSRATLYDGVVHRATATATWLAADVREARVRRLASWQAWSAGEIEAAVGRERSEAESSDQFLLSLYTADPKVNDLDSRESVWRLEVVRGEVATLAGKIEALEPDATLRQLFTFVGPFDTVYRVTVPRGAGGEAPLLRLASALGRIDLQFGGAVEEQPAPAR
jgi:hypothetical protein